MAVVFDVFFPFWIGRLSRFTMKSHDRRNMRLMILAILALLMQEGDGTAGPSSPASLIVLQKSGPVIRLQVRTVASDEGALMPFSVACNCPLNAGTITHRLIIIIV